MAFLCTVLILLITYNISVAYSELRCPVSAEWRLQARVICPNFEQKYVCIFNITSNRHKENCHGPDYSVKGSKLVFHPNFDLQTCDQRRYQPFVFSTNGHSDCVLLKSDCSEEGQVISSSGNSSTDKACRCDYTKGYSFVNKPRDICQCLPSEEDCSCYKTGCYELSPDYECITNGSVFNKSRCYIITSEGSLTGNQTILSADDNSLEIYSLGISSKFILLAALIAMCGISSAVVIMRKMNMAQRRKQEAKSERKKFIHDAILKGERGMNHFVRIFFVGKYGVGKTSLMRRLLWASWSDIKNVKSTDGIDIQTFRIRVEGGKWTPSDDSNDNLSQLIRRTFAKEKQINAPADHQDDVQLGMDETHIEKQEEIQIETEDMSVSAENINQETTPKIYESTEEKILIEMPENVRKESTQLINLQLDKTEEGNNTQNKRTVEKELTASPYKEIDKSEMDKIATSFLDSVLKQSDKKLIYEMFASCWMWDFAGQKDFYATHQAFLSSCGVFLLVTDCLESTKIEPKQEDFENAAKYINFWFDTIHCYWSVKKGTAEKFDPPVIVVFTHEDKYKDTPGKDSRHQELKEELYKTIVNKKVKNHIEDIFFVSNKEDDDKVFEKIRKRISEVAMSLKGWGTELPLKWILFEQLLQKLRENNIPILQTNAIKEFARHQDIGITDDDDFENCLQYFHDIGSIIYFNEDRLKDQVVLNPKWLVDAFKCLVSDKIEYEILGSDDWSEKLKKTGEITDRLITELLRKKSEFEFIGIKNHLIEVMKKFDIVVQIEDTLYMPCTIESDKSKFNQILTKTCLKSSWCCFEFDFLPPAFLNHILAWYIRQYKVSRETDGKRFELYRGVGVFNLDDTRCEQLVVCEAENIVAIQVHVYGDTSVEDMKYNGLKIELNNFITKIKTRYKMNLNITVSFNCGGDFRKDRWTLQQLKNVQQYHCLEHEKNHISQKIYLPWCELDEQSTKENIDDNSEHTIRDVGSHNKPYILGQDIFRLHHQIDPSQVLNVDRIEAITDGMLMNDGRLVLCLQYPHRLLICNTDGSEVDIIPLQYTPWNVTAVNNSTVAVTLYGSPCIEMYDINNKHKLKSIPVPRWCYGITTINNKLVVGCNDRLLMIDDQTREVVKTIHTDCIPLGLHTSGDRIFYSHSNIFRNPNLYCYSYTEDKVTTLTLPSIPYSITSLQDGSLYVVCEDGSVQHVSSNGQHYKQVKTKGLKSLNNKIVICYNRTQRKLFTIGSNLLNVYNQI